MTEDELDRIKKSFVRSSDECPMEVACLLTVMKYYGGQQDARTLAEWCKVDGKYTLMGMKQAAIRAGMEAEICLQNMEQLSTRKFPAILFAINDFEVPGYVVCYGIHEGRFIIWEPYACRISSPDFLYEVSYGCHRSLYFVVLFPALTYPCILRQKY